MSECTLHTDNGPLKLIPTDGWRSQSCQHMELVYDDRAQVVECRSCGKPIPNYIAFKHVVQMMSKMQWQREERERIEDRRRERALRLQETCKHQTAKRIGLRVCDRCGMLLDGTKQPGEAYFEMSMGRVTEIKPLATRANLKLAGGDVSEKGIA